jgi:uncharacterized protein YbaP (TraB family)
VNLEPGTQRRLPRFAAGDTEFRTLSTAFGIPLLGLTCSAPARRPTYALMSAIPNPSGHKYRRYRSRATALIIAIALNIAFVYILVRWMDRSYPPAAPTVEPLVTSLIFEEKPQPRLNAVLRAITPHLAPVTIPAVELPNDLNIVLPVDVHPPPNDSPVPALGSYGNGASPELPSALPPGPVSGDQPGPALWKVTSGATPQHILWILGAPPTPLPHNVVWRSKQVEMVLAGAQEVIMDDPITFDARTRSSPLAQSEYNDMRSLPPGQTLKNVLSDELFARFTMLKTEIGGNSAIDHLRPWAAAAALRDRASQSLGLGNTAVSSAVLRLARRASVIDVNTHPDYQIFERNSKSARTVACLELAVSELETDRDHVKRVTNAWAVGNVAALRSLLLMESPDECLPSLFDSAQQAKDVVDYHDQQWLTAADRALHDQSTSFSLVPIRELLVPDGLVAALRARGYVVEEPR